MPQLINKILELEEELLKQRKSFETKQPYTRLIYTRSYLPSLAKAGAVLVIAGGLIFGVVTGVKSCSRSGATERNSVNSNSFQKDYGRVYNAYNRGYEKLPENIFQPDVGDEPVLYERTRVHRNENGTMTGPILKETIDNKTGEVKRAEIINY